MKRMKKRILSLVLCVILILAQVQTVVFAAGGSDGSVKISATKSTLIAGETTEVTVSINATGDPIGSINFTVVLPKGLELESHEILIKQSDYMFSSFVENVFGCGATATGKTGEFDVLRFTVQAKDTNVGINNITLTDVGMYDLGGSSLLDFGSVDPLIITTQLPAVAVTGVTIQETIAVNAGSKVTPTYTVNPSEATDKKVTFSSNDGNVATVDPASGEITGVKKGTATITVTTNDGGFTDTCIVTVNCAHANKTNHAAGTSTCKEQANDQYYTCDVCQQIFAADQTTELNAIPMLPLSTVHDYTQQIQDAAHLKTEAAKCTEYNVYWYDCSRCDVNAKDDANATDKFYTGTVAGAHLFDEQREDAAHFVTGSGADCQNAKKYYYDCVYCDAIGTTTWTSNSVGEHIMSQEYTQQNNQHFKKCTVNGCEHTTTPENCSGGTATCKTQATCSVCGNLHGNLADHKYTAEVEKDDAVKTLGDCVSASIYYYSCSGCGAVEHNDNHTFVGSKAAHTPADTWETDGTHHWKVCEVNNCGAEIEGSKKEHSSTGENVATCITLAVCDDCGVPYGSLKAHKWDTKWTKDENDHWHSCKTEGCTARYEKAPHTPDHEGGATEDYAVECKICHYEMFEKLPHEHVPGTEWKNNSSYHWHVCEKETCGAVIADSKEAHVDADHNRECDVCGYKLPEPEEEKPEGWIREAAKWYYYDNGKKVKGWKKVGKNWYFMKKTFPDYKAMQTGWIFDEGRWYYLAENGVMKTGWREIGGKWYYLGQSGAMKTGWFFDPDYNAWYYLHDENGDMLVNTTTPDGYYVGADGKWVQ